MQTTIIDAEEADTSSQTDSSNSGTGDLYTATRPPFEETFSTLMINSFKFPLSSKWPFLLPLITHAVVLPIQLLAMGFIPFFQWGTIAQSINNYGFKSILTLGFHFIPYEGHIVLVSIVFVMHWTVLIFSYLSFKGLLTHILIAKFKERIKLFSQMAVILLFIFNVPIIYLFGSFWSCDYTSDPIQSFKLREFKNLECWSPLNAVYASLSFVHFFIQIFCVFVYYFGIVETEPLSLGVKTESGKLSTWFSSKPAPLSTTSPLFFTVISLLEMIFIFYSEMIPNVSTFPYLFPSLSLSIFLILFAFCCFSLPFYVRILNSIYGGLLLGFTGQNVLSLVVSILNLNEKLETEGVMVNGISIFGSSFGSFIIGFIIGFISIEIYTRMKMRQITKWATSVTYSEEFFVNNESIQEMGERNLDLALQFMLLFDDSSIEKKILKAIIRGAIKQKVEFSISGVYINIALLLRHSGMENNDKGNLFLSSQLLKRIYHSKPGIIDRYVCLIRKHENETEIQVRTQTINESEKQVVKILQSIQKNTNKLRDLIRSFWKCITHGRISDELIVINREISKWNSLCNNMYENLLSNYPANRMAMLSYAQFLDEFLFEKDKSKDLIQQVNMLEEEENLKSKLTKTQFNSNSLRISKNKIFPYSTNWSENESFEESKKQVEIANIGEEDYLAEEELFAKKQEESFLKAIQRKNSKLGTNVKTTLLPILSLCMVIAALVATTIISNSFSKTDARSGSELQLFSDLCSSSPYPFYILSGYRLMQRHFYLNTNQTFAYYFMVEEKIKFKEFHHFLEDLLNRVSVSDRREFYKLWEVNTIEMFMPVITTKYNFNTSVNYEKRNSTIKEILEMIETHVDYASDFSKKEIIQTLDNPSFLYLFLNRKYNAYALENFCSDMLNAKIDNVRELKESFVIGMSATIGVFLIFGFVTLILQLHHFMRQSNVVKLFKDIPKEEAGKIYHNLEKKTLTLRFSNQFNIDSNHNNSNSQLNMVTPTRVLILTSLLIFILGLISVSIFLVDINNNLHNQEMALKKLYQASKVKVIVNRTIFKLGEVMLINDWKNLFGSMSEIDRIHKELTSHAREIETYLSSYLNGDDNIGFFSLIGINEELDSLIKPKNCTILKESLNENINTTSLLENRIYFKCMSIDQLMKLYNVHMDYINQLAYRSTFATNIILERYHAITWEIVQSFNTKFNRSLDIFIFTFSRFTGISLSIGTSVVFFITFLIGSFVIYKFNNSYEHEIFQLRQMFNYVSWQIIENVESINTFVLKYQVVRRKNKKLSSKQQNDTPSSDCDVLTSVINSVIDGVIQFNGEGTIEVINPSGLKILGIRTTGEVVGRHISTLFIPTEKDKIEEKVQLLVNHTSQGEVIELNARRGHSSSSNFEVKAFPVVVSLSVAEVESQFNKKQKRSLYTALFRDITSEKKSVELLNMEKKKSENLLLNILPSAVATRLKLGETSISEKFDDVTCLFSDMVGFTAFSSKCSPTELVQMLNEIVNGFDALTNQYRLEKIKTIGDAYFCAGGLYDKESDHPERALLFAIDMYKVLREYNLNSQTGNINIRVGIHTGSVVAGVIGTKKFAFDLWGDAVNTASRMESNSLPGRIQISRSTYVRIFDLGYHFEERNVELKGKGMTQCYLLHEKHNGSHISDSSDSLIQ